MTRSFMSAATFLAASFVSAANACDAVTIAANTGSQLGKATYCGFPTDEFAKRAGRAVDHCSTSNAERAEAIQQFAVAADMAARVGPVGESCSEFHGAYLDSLQILKDAGF
jgi:hypothetical protein